MSQSASPEKTSFPRLSARTLRFTMGVPRTFSISPEGTKITFLRSGSGDDRRNSLWLFDTTTGTERLIAGGERIHESLSAEEKALRERLREASSGITSYTTDSEFRIALFTESGLIRTVDIASGEITQIIHSSSAIDPRPSPDGARIAFATVDGAFRIANREKEIFNHVVAGKIFGQAEFVASEEMNRCRGFWWSPDSQLLLVQESDESAIQIWHISDPAHPEIAPREIRYPQVGTPNAIVSLMLMSKDGDISQRISLPAGYEYLVEVHWSSYGPPLLYLMDRAQRLASIFALDIATGGLSEIATIRDQHWVEVIPGLPAWLPSGELLVTHDQGENRFLTINGEQVTPDGIEVSAVLDIDRFGITFTGTSEPTEQHVYWYGYGGELEQLSKGPGIHSGRARNHTLLLASRTLDEYGVTTEVRREGKSWPIASLAFTPSHDARPEFLRLGKDELRAALLLPESGERTNLPLLVDPYGGPHAIKVVAAKNAYAEAQWIANLGFAVLIADGRGTAHRGPAWEKTISGDLATAPLEDQVIAITELQARYPGLIDPKRIAIRGWSFGGYLAALAVMERPDIFAAGIAGAPVSDFRLYDTFYTERYLGITGQESGYESGSLFPRADQLTRPLMIIHGLADDNVVVAHSLQLSSHLLAAGKPHETLMLSNVTHMTPQEEVAENLLLLQIEFLKRHLTS